MMLPNFPFLTMFIRRESDPVRCLCPIKSLNRRGRSLSANGAPAIMEGSFAFARFAKGFSVSGDATLRFLTTGVSMGSDGMFEPLGLVSRLLEKMGAILLVESPMRRD